MQRVDLKRQLIRGTVEQFPTERLSSVRVGDAMTASPLCVPAQRTALEIVELFQERRFKHLLVSDHGQLVGVLSDRDVVRLFGTHDSAERNYLELITAAELMSIDPLTVGPETPLLDAVSLMLENGIHCLPVVQDGVACGILTSTDLFVTLETLLLNLSNRCPVA